MLFTPLKKPALVDLSLILTTFCQLKCPYCYARHEYKWNKLMSMKTIDEVLQGVEQSGAEFSISLLGGEPTLHPQLNEILSKCYYNNKIKQINIYTNGKRDFNRFLFNSKTKVIFSYHPSEKNFDEIAHNIKVCQKQGIDISIALMMLPRYKDEVNRMYEYAIEHDINDFAATYIVTNTTNKAKMFKSINHDLEMQKMFQIGDTEYTMLDVYEQGLNKFKGWRCYVNDYEISVDGAISRMCTNSSSSNLIGYISKIKFDSVICNFDECKPCYINNFREN